MKVHHGVFLESTDAGLGASAGLMLADPQQMCVVCVFFGRGGGGGLSQSLEIRLRLLCLRLERTGDSLFK